MSRPSEVYFFQTMERLMDAVFSFFRDMAASLISFAVWQD